MSSQVSTPKSSSRERRKTVYQTDAERSVEQIKELEKRTNTDPRTLAKMLNQCAAKLIANSKFRQASEIYAKLTDINRELYGGGHPRTLWSNTKEIMTYNKQLDINNKMRAYVAAQKLKVAEENKKKKEKAEKELKKELKKAAKLAAKLAKQEE